MDPITRKEMYLAKMAGEEIAVPVPITREEMYLAYLAGADATLPEPVTNDECFLARLCGESAPELEPLTRIQMLMAEAIAKKVPDFTTITREEYFWKAYIESMGPQIVYKTVSGAVVSFDDGADNLPVRSLEVEINPVQDLHGYDYPWAGGAGKNLLPTVPALDSTSVGGIRVVSDGQGKITLSGTSTANGSVVLSQTPFIFNGNYIHLLNDFSNSSIALVFDFDDNTTLSPSLSTINKIIDCSKYVGKTVNRIRIYHTANVGTIDGSIMPMIMETNTVSEFTPYSNICPITGYDSVSVYRSGKNLLDANNLESGYYTDTAFTLNAFTNPYRSYKLWLPADTYIISFSTQCRMLRVIKDNTFTILSQDCTSYTFTTTTEGMVGLTWRNADNSDWDTSTTVQLELGDEATAYEPYGDTYTSTLPSTVYGGKLNVTTGELVVDRAYALLNNPDLWEETPTSTTVSYRYASTYFDRKFYSDSFTGLLSSYLAVNVTSSNHVRWAGANSKIIGIKSTSLTLNDIKSAASNNEIEICYDIDPVTYHLTPQEVKTLLGANTIWADSGDVTVEYPAIVEEEENA